MKSTTGDPLRNADFNILPVVSVVLCVAMTFAGLYRFIAGCRLERNNAAEQVIGRINSQVVPDGR
jgi:Na+/H+ antiporter NhaB